MLALLFFNMSKVMIQFLVRDRLSFIIALGMLRLFRFSRTASGLLSISLWKVVSASNFLLVLSIKFIVWLIQVKG